MVTKFDSKLELVKKDIIDLTNDKLNLSLYKDDQRNLLESCTMLMKETDQVKNTLKALESWVEKYQPLRTQHQITNTLNECLNRKAREKLQVYDFTISNELREKILSDLGSPSLREKALNFIE